jgi:hypothetical protein
MTMTTPDPSSNGHRLDPLDDDWSGDIDLGLVRPAGRFRSWAIHAWWRLRYRRTGGYPLLPGPAADVIPLRRPR